MEKYLGILWQRDKYTSQFIVMFRYMALLATFFLLIYGFLVKIGAFNAAHYSDTAFMIAGISLLVLGISSFCVRQPKPAGTLGRLIGFHLAASLYLIGISGFQSPIATCWILLMMGSYYFFGTRGLIVSGGVFAITGFLDFIVSGNTYIMLLLLNGIVASSVILVGSAVILVGHIQNRQHADFQLSRTKESFQRERILALVNSVGDAILNIDSEGIIRLYNAASLNFFDTNQSLNGKKLDDVLTVVDADGEPVSFFKALKATRGVVVREDLSYVFSDGEKARLSISCSPVRASFSEASSAQTGHILIIRDITKAKTLEEERDEFISVVSHELRTPLTIAEGTISNAQFLIKRGDGAPPQISQALSEAHQQILYLAKMVNDLSTLSRAERGVSDSVEAINVEQLMHSLYNEYTPQATAKNLQLNLDLGPKLGTVTTSRLYLEEILQNFITNALKYTVEGSITIIAKRTENGLFFAVKDTGIGISKTDQKKVFNKFYRSEDYRTRETGGTGLGLYVVHKLAQKLATTIHLQSRLNHGSTFSFTLASSSKVTNVSK